jgi:hypothetical protein
VSLAIWFALGSDASLVVGVVTVRVVTPILLLAGIMASLKLAIPIQESIFTGLKPFLIQQQKRELLASQDSLLVTALVLINRQTYNDSAMKKIVMGRG